MELSDISIDQWRALGEGEIKDGCIPFFYMRAIQNETKTEAEGRPIFEDVEFVKVTIPGDKYNSPDMAVTDEHRQKWAIQYERFKEQKDQIEGTPIREWPFLSRVQVAELEALGIQVVEQCAALPEQVKTQLGAQASMFESRAREFLLGDDEVVKKLRGEKGEMQDQISSLQEEIAALKRLLEGGDELEDDKPKRGRPRKVDA